LPLVQGYHLTNFYYGKAECDCCQYKLPVGKKRIALSRSKKVKSGFWCVGCALDKHVITDREVIDFLKSASAESFRYRPRVEHVRY
jgi:hypothetical protein